MPVIIVGTEKNFAALRTRLFSGRVSNAKLQEVTEAVAEANPHVDLNSLKPGTVLTIPDSPHLSVSGDISLDDSTKELVDAVANAGVGPNGIELHPALSFASVNCQRVAVKHRG